jgi:hypothetical protein
MLAIAQCAEATGPLRPGTIVRLVVAGVVSFAFSSAGALRLTESLLFGCHREPAAVLACHSVSPRRLLWWTPGLDLLSPTRR